MPLTLPSHAAAILPLTRLRFLPPSALVIGAAAPDLGYLLGLRGSHVWSGLLPTVLPAGLLAWLWAEWLLLPLLREVLPPIGRLRPTHYLATRGVSLRPGPLAAAAVAVIAGACTHLIWDGFTHDGLWPASRLYPEVTAGLPFGLTVARALQHLSTLVGGALVLAAWARAAGAKPDVATTSSTPAVGLRWWHLALLVVVAAAFQGVRELRWLHPSTPWTLLLWKGFWAASRGGLAALTAAGIWAFWRRRRTRREGPAPALEEPPRTA